MLEETHGMKYSLIGYNKNKISGELKIDKYSNEEILQQKWIKDILGFHMAKNLEFIISDDILNNYKSSTLMTAFSLVTEIPGY